MPPSLQQFVDQLIASRLFSDADLDALRSSFPSEPPLADGEQLARSLVKQKKLTAYQAQQVYSGKGKSLVLGNYAVLDKLGEGGMGMVLKAEHRRMERVVALKVLSPRVTKSPDAVKRFQREITAWVNALDLFQGSEVVRGAFGASFQEIFSRLKHAERSNFERIVTPLDHLWYSRVA